MQRNQKYSPWAPTESSAKFLIVSNMRLEDSPTSFEARARGGPRLADARFFFGDRQEGEASDAPQLGSIVITTSSARSSSASSACAGEPRPVDAAAR
jgi:glycyl-tRNA synthetase beta subunit